MFLTQQRAAALLPRARLSGYDAPPCRAQGAVDSLICSRHETAVLGWILHPKHLLRSVQVYCDRTLVGSAPIELRSDLACRFEHVSHAGHSGFHVRGAGCELSGPLVTISVVGLSEKNDEVVFTSHRLTEPSEYPILPDQHLIRRVAGTNSSQGFTKIGLDATIDLMRVFEDYLDLECGPKLLDWGCGPGRVASYVTMLWPQLALVGCDIDHEAVNWCNLHVRSGAFHVNKPHPPLPFDDASFDAVIACSVMTHLAWPMQRLWLGEIRRVLKHRGLFVASVHGEFAASFYSGVTNDLKRLGIVDTARDKSLDGVAPPGYYRATFQTREFTCQNWGSYFGVLKYIEAGLTGFQDLVILRRE